MKTIIIFLSISMGFAVRWSRWLAILQQKEYRFDRLIAFTKSNEGRHELLRLVPQKTDFSRLGWKRPKPTPRIGVVLIFSLFLITGWLVWGMYLFRASGVIMIDIGFWFSWLLILYVSLPGVVILAGLPTALVNKVMTQIYLQRASDIFTQYQPTIIGVTGSFGKTSTKQLIGQVLGGDQQVFITPESFNTKLSVAQSICTGYRGQKFAVIEYAAYSKHEIAELARWFQPHEAIITGFASQHLGLFGGNDQIIQAKSELVAALPDGSKVYYWAEDEGVLEIVQLGTQGKKLTLLPYTTSGSQAVKVDSAGISPHGHLECVSAGMIVKTKLVGLHYLPAVVAAITVGSKHGVKTSIGWQRITDFQPTNRFIQRKSLVNDSSLIDDGISSNPAGFRSMINLADRLMARKKILVTSGIVDLGSSSSDIHRQLAEFSLPVFDQVLYLGQPGRKEFIEVMGHKVIYDQSQIQSLLTQIEAGTLVVIEGLVPGWVQTIIKNLQVSW